MLAAGYGRIINTASMASLLVPHPQKQVSALLAGLNSFLRDSLLLLIKARMFERDRKARPCCWRCFEMGWQYSTIWNAFQSLGKGFVWKCGLSCLGSTLKMRNSNWSHGWDQIAYNASKAAVVKITQTLGCEWADRGVTVNCMSPGIVNTALIQARPLLLAGDRPLLIKYHMKSSSSWLRTWEEVRICYECVYFAFLSSTCRA